MPRKYSALESLIGKFLGDTATEITQRALRTDPNLKQKLDDLDGRVIEIQCTIPPVNWHLRVEDGALKFAHGSIDQPNVIVRGALWELAGWFFQGPDNSPVEVQGDDTLLLELLDIIRQFQPDIEDPLSEFLGPEIASSILGTAETGLRGLHSLVEGVGRSLQNTASEKFVQKKQLDSLLGGIDDLRLRVDRLAANVRAAEQKSDHGRD